MSSLNPLSQTSTIFQTYSSLGKMQDVTQEQFSGSSFLNQVFQKIPQALEDSRAHEGAVKSASDGKISELELLQKTTQADLSFREVQAIFSKGIAAFKEIQNIAL